MLACSDPLDPVLPTTHGSVEPDPGGTLRFLSGASLAAGVGTDASTFFFVQGWSGAQVGWEPIAVGDVDGDGRTELVFPAGTDLGVLPSDRVASGEGQGLTGMPTIAGSN